MPSASGWVLGLGSVAPVGCEGLYCLGLGAVASDGCWLLCMVDGAFPKAMQPNTFS